MWFTIGKLLGTLVGYAYKGFCFMLGVLLAGWLYGYSICTP